MGILCVKDNEVKDAALSDQIIYVETEIPGETAGSYTCSGYAMHFTGTMAAGFTLIMIPMY